MRTARAAEELAGGEQNLEGAGVEEGDEKPIVALGTTCTSGDCSLSYCLLYLLEIMLKSW